MSSSPFLASSVTLNSSRLIAFISRRFVTAFAVGGDVILHSPWKVHRGPRISAMPKMLDVDHRVEGTVLGGIIGDPVQPPTVGCAGDTTAGPVAPAVPLGLIVDPVPVMVIPTCSCPLASPAKTVDGLSRQRMAATLHMMFRVPGAALDCSILQRHVPGWDSFSSDGIRCRS